jgi:hypothetical protein
MLKFKFLMEKEEEKGGASWRDTLPEGIRNDPSITSFKDVGALTQSFIETKKLVGNSVRPPGPDATPEARTEFIGKMKEKLGADFVYFPTDAKARAEAEAAVFAALGRPGKPEEYVVPDDLVKLGVVPEDIRAIAQKTGMTKGQFAELTKAMGEMQTAAQSKFKDDHAALEKEWGAAKSDRFQAAAAVAEKLGLAADAKAIAEGRASAAQVKLMFQVAQAVGTNPKEQGRQTEGGSSKMTPTEARAQIGEMMANRAHAYWNASDPRHGEAVKRMIELQQYADPKATREMAVAGARS